MRKVPLGKPYLKTDVMLEHLREVIDSRWISGGPTITKFETVVKEYNNDRYGRYIAVSNGTVALELALLMLNDGRRYTEQDEIITTAWSWVATGFVVPQVGATPVWADVDFFGSTDAEDIEYKITDHTKAIIVVHQMGIPVDMDEVNKIADKYGIPLIEDGACAVGSEYKGKKIGKSDNIVTYSFQARKVLTTGEGGMIVVRDEEQESWLRSFRAFGTNTSPLQRAKTDKIIKEYFDKVGGNYKLSDIASSVGLAHLTYLDEEIELRETAGEYYNEYIMEMTDQGYPLTIGNRIPDYCTRYNWQNYHVILNHGIDRDSIVDKLKQRGVGVKWDIQSIAHEPVFVEEWPTGPFPDDLPVTQVFHDQGMWLPFFAEITREEQDYVIEQLKEVLDEL